LGEALVVGSVKNCEKIHARYFQSIVPACDGKHNIEGDEA
jgi:hypothetical protein